MKKTAVLVLLCSLTAIFIACDPDTPIDKEREEIPDAGVDLRTGEKQDWQRDFDEDNARDTSTADTSNNKGAVAD